MCALDFCDILYDNGNSRVDFEIVTTPIIKNISRNFCPRNSFVKKNRERDVPITKPDREILPLTENIMDTSPQIYPRGQSEIQNLKSKI